MTRHPSAPIAVIATICLLGLTQTGCWDELSGIATVTAAPPPDGSIVIAVIADHFVAGQEVDFETAVTNVFDHSLLIDPDYSPHAAAFSVVPIFEAFVPSTPSDYGIEVVAGANCNITWKDTTTGSLEDAIARVEPTLNPNYIIVIGNDTGTFGCATRHWAYVTAGSFGTPILEHEAGHLFAGLYDEYVSEDLQTAVYPEPLECRNCSTNAKPHWHKLGLPEPFTDDTGCKLYGRGIVRPTSNCRMGATGVRFCDVCKREMDRAFAYYDNPDDPGGDVGCPVPGSDATDGAASPPAAPRNLRIQGAGLLFQPTPQPTPSQLVRVVVTLNRLTNAASVQRARNVTGRFIPNQRRLGRYVYEVSEAGKTITVGVVSGDPFEAHDFRGSPRHQVQQLDRAEVVVVIPGTVEALRAPARAVQINFYRLATTVTAPLITASVLNDAKAKKEAEPFAEISAAALRSAM